jgi:hypothetical protein
MTLYTGSLKTAEVKFGNNILIFVLQVFVFVEWVFPKNVVIRLFLQRRYERLVQGGLKTFDVR